MFGAVKDIVPKSDVVLQRILFKTMEMGCLNIMQNRSDNRIYAGFFVRLAAYLTDIIIVWCAMLVIRIPVWVTTLQVRAIFL